MTRLDLLLSRIDAVIKRGTFPSERAWCGAAKVSPSYIGALRNRGATGGTGEVRDVKHEKIAKLARAAGVEVSWLMGDDTKPSQASHEGLERAMMTFDWPDTLTASEAKQVRDKAIAEASAAGADDLPVRYWLNRLGRIAAEVRQTVVSSGVQPSRKAK